MEMLKVLSGEAVLSNTVISLNNDAVISKR
jgi:hypothetical protein